MGRVLKLVTNPSVIAPRELKVITDEFVTVPEAAKQLGRPKVTLYRWIDANKLIAVTFGGILFVPTSEIKRLNNEKAETTNASA